MKIILFLVEFYLRLIGFHKKRAQEFMPLLYKDWLNTPIPFRQKVWAYRRGFLSSRIELYGLNDNNYREYLSDIDYWRHHPYNNHFAFWINDKLTLKYMLSGLDPDLMPEYYLYVENDGSYSYLMDAPLNIPKNKDFILNLLYQKKILALKPNAGHGGAGFVKLAIDNNIIYVNNQSIEKDKLNWVVKKLNGYIVTEWISQHHDLDKIYRDTVCTLRIVALKNNRNDHHSQYDYSIIVSYARFGTKKSGGASNLSSGGVAIPFDFETGKLGNTFYRYKNYKFYGDYSMTLYAHPDTGYTIKDDVLPLNEEIKNTVKKICGYLSSLDYFGFDLFITEKGIKVCEINSKPALNYEQVMCGPINKNPAAVNFFTRKGIKHLKLSEQR
jgi:hypothetical protein